MYIQIQHELFVAYKILLERVLPIDTRILRFTPTTVKSLSVDGEERGGRWSADAQAVSIRLA